MPVSAASFFVVTFVGHLIELVLVIDVLAIVEFIIVVVILPIVVVIEVVISMVPVSDMVAEGMVAVDVPSVMLVVEF